MLLCFCCSAITPTPNILYINIKRGYSYRLENIHNLFSISLYIQEKKPVRGTRATCTVMVKSSFIHNVL